MSAQLHYSFAGLDEAFASITATERPLSERIASLGRALSDLEALNLDDSVVNVCREELKKLKIETGNEMRDQLRAAYREVQARERDRGGQAHLRLDRCPPPLM